MIKNNSPFDKEKLYEAKRKQILSNAAKLFNVSGTRATTLQDIASSLGVTKSSLYYYVKTKEELIYQCYMTTCEHDAQVLSTVKNLKLPAIDRIRLYLWNMFMEWRSVKEEQAVNLALILEMDALTAVHQREVKALYVANALAILDLITEGIKDGSIKPCDPLATTLAIIGTTSWAPIWLFDQATHEIQTVCEQITDIILNGLSANDKTYKFSTTVFSSEKILADYRHSFNKTGEKLSRLDSFVHVGTKLFNQKGFSATSLDEISNELNMTKGAFYHYIKDKDDLLKKCFEQSLYITEKIQNTAAKIDGDGLSKIEHCCRELFYIQNSEIGPLIRYNSAMALAPKQKKLIFQRTQNNSKRLSSFLVDGMKDGSIREIDPSIVEMLVSGAIHCAMEMSIWQELTDIEKGFTDYFNVFFNGIKA
jgi:AcrR family transcriptional regulator